MDISDTLAPNSDQLDAVDLLGGPRTFTIARVTVDIAAEQPVQVYLNEFPRPWLPGKSMRRVLGACWGNDSSQWTGRAVTLFCDPAVKFGGVEVGGTRISHLSHIDGVRKVPLLVARGKSATYTVQPLKDVPAPPKTQPDGPDMSALVTALDAAGVGTADRLAYCVNLVGRDLRSAADLTSAEASRVIDALKADAEQVQQDALPVDGGA